MVSVAALQFSCTSDAQNNVERAEAMVRKAAKEGAQIILLQELFANLYFCQAEHPSYFAWAEEEDSSPMLQRFAVLAKELQVVCPARPGVKQSGERESRLTTSSCSSLLLCLMEGFAHQLLREGQPRVL
jgi:N-carbamoylputrescine amidase